MRMNRIGSIFSELLQYIELFDATYYEFSTYPIKAMFELVKRRREGGGDMIKHLCSILTNDGVKRGSGYMKRIVEWTSEEKKRDGMNCLKILYLNVYGMEMRREWYRGRLLWTGRRMREVWNDEGKADEEGRREWERKWREVGDIMNEEDVMETSIMLHS